MSKQRTELSRYPSKYSPKNWVSCAQYIIELLCEKLARTKGKDLPVQFWHLKEWANFYKSQLRITHKLLAKYSEKAIIAVIKDRNIWSLRPKWVEDLIIKKQREIDLSKIQVVEKENSQDQLVVSEFKSRPFRPSSKTRLLGLDDE